MTNAKKDSGIRYREFPCNAEQQAAWLNNMSWQGILDKKIKVGAKLLIACSFSCGMFEACPLLTCTGLCATGRVRMKTRK